MIVPGGGFLSSIYDKFCSLVKSIQYFNSFVDQQGVTWSNTGGSISGGQYISGANTDKAVYAITPSFAGDFSIEVSFSLSGSTGFWIVNPFSSCSIFAVNDVTFTHPVSIELVGYNNQTLQWTVNGTRRPLGISASSGVLALTRASGTYHLFLNGALIDSVADANNSSISASLFGGTQLNGLNWFASAAFDNIRITGACRYVNTYSIPAIPYPACP